MMWVLGLWFCRCCAALVVAVVRPVLSMSVDRLASDQLVQLATCETCACVGLSMNLDHD